MTFKEYIDTQRIFSRHGGETETFQSAPISLTSHSRKEYYQCPYCKQFTSKNDAIIAGYDSEHSLRHIHCPTCGKIIAWPSESSNRLKNIIEGASLTIAGGALAFLLFPSLNIYGLQAGFFASLFGILKMLIL